MTIFTRADLVARLRARAEHPANRRMIEVPLGWTALIAQLDDELCQIDPNYRLTQVKDKFSRLRYYFTTEDSSRYSAMMELVTEAERRSFTLCFYCGAEAEPETPTLQREGHTLCPSCTEKRGFKREI